MRRRFGISLGQPIGRITVRVRFERGRQGFRHQLALRIGFHALPVFLKNDVALADRNSRKIGCIRRCDSIRNQSSARFEGRL